MDPAVSSAAFVVHEVFDLSCRGGLLVVGQATGAVTRGTQLVDAAGTVVSVLGVEFLTPRNSLDGTITILLPRGCGADLRPGSVWSRRSD